MLTLDANFTREMNRAGNSPTVLVNVGGLQKFVLATRNVLGYPKSVLAITKFSSLLDPITAAQTMAQATVEIGDDGIFAALNAANYLVGKTLTLSLGFDTGSDASFPEGSYAGFGGGIIIKVERLPGKFVITANDPRTSFFDALKTHKGKTWLPAMTAAGNAEAVQVQGAAVQGFKTLLDKAGIPSSFYSASSFLVANNAPIGHMVMERNLRAYGVDRTIKKPAPLAETLSKIASILRGYILVDELNQIGFKLFDPNATPVDRFRQTDFLPDSFRMWQDTPTTITSAIIRSAYDNLNGGSGDAYMATYRDSNGTAAVNWGYTGGTPLPADLQIDDESFCSFLATLSHDKILSADTTIKVIGSTVSGSPFNNFTGCPAAVPVVNGVDASHPGYLLVKGTGTSDTGEVIKYTSITDNRAVDLSWILGGLTRGMFGTTQADHNAANPDAIGSIGYGCAIIDITPLVWCATGVLQRYSTGVPSVEVKTGLSKYGIQVGDLVYADFPLYNRQGLSTLADGNTTAVFEVLGKDVDYDTGTITWTLMEVRNVAYTSAAIPTITLGERVKGQTDTSMAPVSDATQLLDPTLGISAAFVAGNAPATSASLTTTIPRHRAITGAGHVILDSQSMTFGASKDTYVDLDPQARGMSNWRLTPVANGAAAPAVPAGCKRAFKVVTSGSAVTSVQDLRNKGLSFNGTISAQAVAMAPPNSDGMPYTFVQAPDGTNFLPNPSLEVNATDDWSIMNPGGVVPSPTGPTQDTSAGNFYFGTASSKCTSGNSGSQAYLESATFVAVTPGDVLSLSAYEKLDSVNFAPGNLALAIGWYNSSHVDLGGATTSVFQPQTVGTGNATNWQRYSVTGTAPAGAAYAKARVFLQQHTTNGVAITTWTDGVLFEKSSVPTPYFDGSMPSCAWSGTPNNSSSTRTGGFTVYGPPALNTQSIVGWDRGMIDFYGFHLAGGGAAFPAVAGDGDLFYRTDRNILYQYSGAVWISVNEYVLTLPPYNIGANSPFSIATTPVDALLAAVPQSDSGQILLLKWVIEANVVAPNTAASHWLLSLKNLAGTTIDSVGTDTIGGGGAGWHRTERTGGTLLSIRTTSTDAWYDLVVSKAGATGLPGNLSIASELHYRVVG